MIGRVLAASLLFAGLAITQSAAHAARKPGPPEVTHVTWQGHGLVTWERQERRGIAIPTVHRVDFSLAPGRSKVIAQGARGQREVTLRCWQRDGGAVRSSFVSAHVVRKPHPRIVADGVGKNSAFVRFEARGIARTAYLARSAMEMVATAYTANCAGCGGMTAIGRRAGHGIVAVDPRVIPLGTRLFIPGYGLAIAGDTGGAIRGHRIDLGFDSSRDALNFGRRAVIVYRLK